MLSIEFDFGVLIVTFESACDIYACIEMLETGVYVLSYLEVLWSPFNFSNTHILFFLPFFRFFFSPFSSLFHYFIFTSSTLQRHVSFISAVNRANCLHNCLSAVTTSRTETRKKKKKNWTKKPAAKWFLIYSSCYCMMTMLTLMC